MSKKTGHNWGVIALVIGGFVVTGAGVMYFVFRKPTKKAGAPTQPNTQPANKQAVPPVNNVQTPPPQSAPDTTFPLQMGSQGFTVKQLQWALQGLGQSLPEYGVDGMFGSETQAALQAITGKTTVDSQAELNAIINKQFQPVSTAQIMGFNWNPTF